MTRHDDVEHFRTEKLFFIFFENAHMYSRTIKSKSRKGKQWATKLGLLTYQKKMW